MESGKPNVNSESYTNRELWLLMDTLNKTNELKHDAIIESMKDFQEATTEKLSSILAQTTKTNGSVRDLLMWRENVRGRTYLIPLLIAALVSGGVGLLFKYL